MNKNSIIGIILIFGILFGFSYLNRPSEEELAAKAKKEARQDSMRQVRAQEIARIDSLKAAQAEATEMAANNTIQTIVTENGDTIQQTQLSKEELLKQAKYGVFYHALKGEDKDIVLENDKIKLKVSTLSGAITYAEVKDYVTYDSLPLVLFNKETSNFSFLLNNQQVQSNELFFEPYFEGIEKDEIYVEAGQEASLKMRLYPKDDNGQKIGNSYMEFEYILTGDDYMLDFNLNLNQMNDYVANGYSDIYLTWAQHLHGLEKSTEQELQQTTAFYKYLNGDVDDLGIRSADDKKEELTTEVEWISHKQQFFSSTLIGPNVFKKGKVEKKVMKDVNIDNYLVTMASEINVIIGRGDMQTASMQMYYGPNKYKVLKEYELDLEQQIPLGWSFLLHYINRYAVIPVFDFLSGFGWNIGIIILVLTILLKLVLFPIAYKTYQSSAKMRVLKPEVEEINAKYPKKEDAVKKQQATMALYKKAGANPMSGCLPMLLQMPILIAMFRFFPASIELRQKSFLWAEDMSAYDSIWTFPNGFEIPFYGDHVSLFTLLMTVTTIFYTKINNQMMGAGQQQLPGMKTMMYLMPVMFLGFFNNYAAGLSYYYFLANVITFIQMFAFRMLINEDKIYAKIQENKKKPVKKSNFAKRLEEMQKIQQQQQQKKK
jgi:YidC/Oxa1 family membrane protein insertase